MPTLLIDTTNHNQIILELRENNEVLAKLTRPNIKISENLLTLADKFLKQHGAALGDLDEVRANPGPGGFSSTRTGVATANALNFVLNKHDYVLPKYAHEPNITKPKRKENVRH